MTDEHTGKALGELDTVRQAVHRVVRTPLHTRPMTPMFGLDQPALAALPMNPVGTARLAGEVAKAVSTWEPRASVERTQFDGDMGGRVSASIIARADGVPFQVDMRSTETLSDMRLRPAYLWEPGVGWAPTLGDPGAVSADGPTRVFDGLTLVEITGLEFGIGEAWTLGLEVTLPLAPPVAMLEVPGVVELSSHLEAVCPGFALPDPFGPFDDYSGSPEEQDYLAGLDTFPPGWFFVSHDGVGNVTVGLGEVATTRAVSGTLPAASSIVLGPAAMTVHRLAYWQRELTARERVAFFRECQRAQ